ncbi:MAG: diaminopimelate decarboxylase [Terriglobales bacterium]|jgi:diaminopimelate decarboxylase|nr:diaminopimelate decarboxylase [Terriglobales bacterium]
MRTTQLPGRPPGFAFFRLRESGEPPRAVTSALHCEGLPAAQLAHRFGTPLYVYSAAAIRERVGSFERAFRKVPHTICYSVKANSNLSILKLLAKSGCGFDVVSGGELARVVRADKRAAKRVVFSGVGKTRDEMLVAIRAGILLFNLESESEMRVLAEVAEHAKRPVPIAFRVNPDVPAKTHPYISTGLQKHKFGVPIAEARALYAKAAATKYLKIAGVSVHIGSQITDMNPFAAAMDRVAELVLQVRADGHRIEYVDAGGGLGISYEKGSSGFEGRVADYAEALLKPLRKLDVHLLLEPGRSIVASAGILLTRVIYKKWNGAKQFLVVDAAMNDLIRPSLYQAYHEIVAVAGNGSSPNEIVDVVGPVCETGDFFARDRSLPSVNEGDLLAILDAGAYGMVLASNYNTRPRAAEVLVDGKSAKVIRRRETITDLLRQED